MVGKRPKGINKITYTNLTKINNDTHKELRPLFEELAKRVPVPSRSKDNPFPEPKKKRKTLLIDAIT